LENNLAETAFFVKEGENFHIRWFTPTVEVDLCGHATLAAAYVLFKYEKWTSDTVIFQSRSGKLSVKKTNNLLTLDFPTDTLTEVELFPLLKDAFDIVPTHIFRGKTDYMLVFDNENQIKTIRFDLNTISQIHARGIIITAKGDTVDFVSRFFAPASGVNEDPVTGSAHTTLTPYWAKRLGKNELTAMQLSLRKGHLHCKYLGERVEISGYARTYLIGNIYID
jgi:PhzF family phenazine biosynthesis protein